MPNPVSKLSQYVIRNPFTAASAVFAPIFAKNEDRGYFRTALITTPVIFATGELAPRLFGGVRDISRGIANTVGETANLLKKSEKWTRFEQTNFNDINTLYKSGASSNTIERGLSAWLVSERRSRDFMKEEKLLNRFFNRKFVKTIDLVSKAEAGDLRAVARLNEIEQLHATKGRLITNAMHTARRSSLTPLEWSTEPSGIAPEISPERLNDWLQSQYNEFKGRPEFVRTLRNKLRNIRNLDYSGTMSTINSPLSAGTKIEKNLDFAFDSPLQQAFKSQAPGAFAELEKAQRNKFIGKVTVEAEEVTSGKIGRVLNVKVERMGNLKPLTIPIVDPITGSVRLGPNAVGVGNYVIGPDRKPYRIDEWISKMLAEREFTNEQLQEEIAAHAYWFAGDPLDARRMGELESFGKQGASLLNPQAIKLRSYGAGVTKLPLFDVGGEELVGFHDYRFGANNKVNFIRDLLNENRFVSMGSEAGVYEGRFQLREAASLSPFGAPSAEKQDPFWRSVTKEYRLSAPSGMPAEAVPTWRSTAWETLTGSSELPGAKFTVAGINPQDRTLFSELPRTLDELHFQRTNVIQKFLNRGMSPKAATATYNDIYGIYQQGQQGIFDYLGGMGETGFVMDPKFATNFQVEGISKYTVDELGNIGVKGATVNPTDVLGFNQGETVTPKFTGIVQDVSEAMDSDGRLVFNLNIKHELNMQGAKIDIAGIKGMTRVAQTNEHFQQLRDVMNKYYERLGTGDIIPSNVNVLAPAEYFTNKVEPAQAYLGIGSDIVNRLEAVGAGDVATEYLQRMAAEGITREGGQMVINAASNPVGDKAAADRLLRLSQINEEFFEKAGRSIRTNQGYKDPVLGAFVTSGQDLGKFMMKNQLPAIGFTWDHSLANVPRFSSISHDVETYMALGGNWRGLRAMRSRLQTVSGGSANQALDFMKHVTGGDFSKPFGTVVPLKGAIGRGSLTDAKIRAGSIFDPSIEAYKNNFSLDLGGGRFLPVPGTGAYGAEGSMYGPGRYEAKDWQVAVQELVNTSPENRAPAEAKVLEEYVKQFGVGKGSAVRPYQYDPMAVPGFLSTAGERGDPFVARVSRQFVERVRSERLRKALMAGEDVVGMIQRQPTNELLYMKYRLDPNLEGTMDVAVPESISRALMGDQDKDLVNNILFDANIRMEEGRLVVSDASSQIEREAAEEGIAAMGEKQLQQLAIWQEIKGADEIAKQNVNFELASLAQKNAKFAEAVADRAGVAVKRTAGASIGTFSNVLTEMVEHMVRDPHIMQNPDLVQRLKTGLFDIRQAPISARKAHVEFNLEAAQQMADRLHKAIQTEDPTAAADAVHSSLLSMAENLSPMGAKGPEYKYWATQGAEDIKAWAAGRSEKARLMAALFTTNVDKTKPFKPLSKRARRVSAEAFRDIESTIGAVHGGRMADRTASQLGMVSEHLTDVGRDIARSATGKIGRIFAEHGGSVAMGVGVLAALGVALTSRIPAMATFSRTSSNQYNPEEMIGSKDHIPGEPMPGEMAPTNRPRRMIASQPGVRTTVVAPMGATSDLTVKMRATDHSRAAETARQIAMIPGTGDTNVTINYRDRTKLGSLRTKERIRDIIA